MMSKQCMLMRGRIGYCFDRRLSRSAGGTAGADLRRAAGGQAYVTHYAKWSGYVTYPSTLWEVNAADGAAEVIQDAVTQYERAGCR